MAIGDPVRFETLVAMRDSIFGFEAQTTRELLAQRESWLDALKAGAWTEDEWWAEVARRRITRLRTERDATHD